MSDWEIPTDWDDPFMDEQYAQDFADVVALPGADTYHTDQARNWHYLKVRAAVKRVSTDVDDIAHSIPTLAATEAALDELAEQVDHAIDTLGRVWRALNNLPSTDTREDDPA